MITNPLGTAASSVSHGTVPWVMVCPGANDGTHSRSATRYVGSMYAMRFFASSSLTWALAASGSTSSVSK